MKYVYLILLCACCTTAFSQMRLVAIGSSTTGGTGAFPADSSWVRRFSHYYKNELGLLDSAYNLGWGGASPYFGMPSSYVPPPTRQSSNSGYNVTRAVSLLAGLPIPANGVVIVNYPTNGYDTLSIAEVLNCLQVIYDSATRLGNKCYVTTTQPRGGGSFFTSPVKRRLAILRDSIINRFGTAHTINFYDGLYNPADSLILPAYKSGSDDIHFNNAGHRILFERVKAKNVFSALLPVKLHQFTGSLRDGKAALQWQAEQVDDPAATFTVQRSQDGKDFESLQQVPVRTEAGSHRYQYTDEQPLPGDSYYRLSIQERQHRYFSKVVLIKNVLPELVIKRLYAATAARILQLEVTAGSTRAVTIEVINSQGTPVHRLAQKASKGLNAWRLPLPALAGGVYYLRLSSPGLVPVTRSFHQ